MDDMEKDKQVSADVNEIARLLRRRKQQKRAWRLGEKLPAHFRG